MPVVRKTCRCPRILPGSRDGFRMGNAQLVDYGVRRPDRRLQLRYHMGVTAENIATKYDISREEQDQLSVTSQKPR